MGISKFLSREEIEKRVKELGAQISKEYKDKDLVLVGVLNGSFIFMADLVREITTSSLEIEFMGASSYEGTQSTGEVKINLDLKKGIEGKHILLLEDIVDTGLTISCLLRILKARKPASLKLCSLLYKPARLKHKVDIDYLGFEIEDKFVVGYGLDFNGKFRGLPHIGIYSED